MPELYLRKVIVDLMPAVGSSRKLDGLRVTFKVEKTNSEEPNKAKIEIYNLSPETRGVIESKGMRIALSIGYEGFDPNGKRQIPFISSSSVQSVFIGDVEKVIHRFDGPDIVSCIEAKDGNNRYRNARIDRGFPPHSTLKQIISALDLQLGLAKGRFEGVPDFTYANGITLSGQVAPQLTMLTKSFDLEWSIQDEALQIIPVEQTLSDVAILVNKDTGLVGHPSKTDAGVEFSMLIQPKVRPARAIQLESKYINGVFKPYKVSHVGDSFQGEFLTKVETAKRPKKKRHAQEENDDA